MGSLAGNTAKIYVCRYIFIYIFPLLWFKWGTLRRRVVVPDSYFDIGWIRIHTFKKVSDPDPD